MRLENRKALVIGGNRGIGKAIALGFAREGADVAITYAHHADEGRQVAAEIQGMGRKALAVQMDLRNVAQVQEVVAGVIAEMGHLDILVNNGAIVSFSRSILDLTEEEYDRVMDVNMKGIVFAIQVAARHMVQRRSGKIVNVTSAAQVRSGPGGAVYSASKGGLTVLTKGIAHDLGPYGINVNCLVPSTVVTPGANFDEATIKDRLTRIPLKRVSHPEDMVGTAVFLCSDDAAYVHGASIYVDGGAMMVS